MKTLFRNRFPFIYFFSLLQKNKDSRKKDKKFEQSQSVVGLTDRILFPNICNINNNSQRQIFKFSYAFFLSSVQLVHLRTKYIIL